MLASSGVFNIISLLGNVEGGIEATYKNLVKN